MRTLLFTLLVAGAACKQAPADQPLAADNTGRNARSNEAVPTADQAAQSGTDLELTAKIRKALVGADNLSMNAMNAKIVVDKGVVTLAGPVASDAERTRLASIAQEAGATSVVNQLEIAN